MDWSSSGRKCVWQLCLCGACPRVARVKRARVRINGRVLTVNGPMLAGIINDRIDFGLPALPEFVS